MLHSPQRVRWSGERNFRLGYLAALGWTPEQIAADDDIRSTPAAVRRQLQRMGGTWRDRPLEAISAETCSKFDEHAIYYAIPGPKLMHRVLGTLANQSDLLHTVAQKGGLRVQLGRNPS